MANFSLRSPGFYAREIEVFPVSTPPQQGGAGAVGTAETGPAFIPVTVGNPNSLNSVFGNIQARHQGVMAGYEFLRQGGGSYTYMRVLGAGTAPRVIFTGVDVVLSHTPNAGFVVGQPQHTATPVDDDYIVANVSQVTSSVAGAVLPSAANSRSSIYFLGGTFTDSDLANTLTGSSITLSLIHI